jgi:hypothetical protein
MSGLREKIADAIAGAVSQDDRYLEHADAVLRVLAEHGDTQQVREQLDRLLFGDQVAEVMAVVAPVVATRDAAIERAKVLAAIRDTAFRELSDETVRAVAAEADLAAARQQLDQVRELHRNDDGDWCDNDGFSFPCPTIRLLDAPARPAGHDESGQ